MHVHTPHSRSIYYYTKHLKDCTVFPGTKYAPQVVRARLIHLSIQAYIQGIAYNPSITTRLGMITTHAEYARK